MSHHLYDQSLLFTINIEPTMNRPWANNCNKDIKMNQLQIYTCINHEFANLMYDEFK
jgi:hypothetical protein